MFTPVERSGKVAGKSEERGREAPFLTLLATLTLRSEEYSVTGLVAVGLAIVLGAG